jgi:putative NADPH-quinone reductase
MRNGHQIRFHDLYAEAFDPLLFTDEFSRERPFPKILRCTARRFSTADGIIIIHPNWWGQPPAS